MSSVKVVKDNWREVSLRLARNIEGGVSHVSSETEKQIKAYIVDPPGGGSPTAAADDRNGLVDTRNYIQSWLTKVAGTQGEVATVVEYGVYLEYGHFQKTKTGRKWIPAYPHIVPAAKKIQDRVVELFGRLDR